MFKLIILLLCVQFGNSATLKERLNIASKSEKPILTIFSAKWCAPCRLMEKDVIEPMVASGELNSVSVIHVDVDIDKEFTTRQIGENFTIPTTILFFKEDGKWLQYKITGYETEYKTRHRILQIIELQKKRK